MVSRYVYKSPIVAGSCRDVFYLHINMHTGSAEILNNLFTSTRYIIEGDPRRRLICVGVGYPPPSVQWNRMISDRVYTNMSMSTNKENIARVTAFLFLADPHRDDTGVYECLISSQLKNITKKVYLTVRCMQ